MPRKFIPPLGGSAPVGYDFVYKYTAGVFHAYADSSMLDDTGDGLSWLTAKKTLEAAVAVLPDIAYDHVVLHLKGTFTLSGTVLFIGIQVRGNGKQFIIDGGDDIIIVDGPYTATSSSTTTLTDTARSWGVNALQGCAVEILDGAAAGYIYTIQSNTLDTITVGRTWPLPGTCQYRVIKPATLITSVGSKNLYFTGKADHRIGIQRLRVSGGVYLGTLSSIGEFGYFQFGDVLYESGTGYFIVSSGYSCAFWEIRYDPFNPASQLNPAKDRRGVSYLGTGTHAVYCATSQAVFRHPCVFKKQLVAIGVLRSLDTCVVVGSGTLLNKLVLRNSNAVLGYNASYGTTPILESSSDVGLDAKDSRIVVNAINYEIRNCASHAIQLDNSILECQSAILSGSGNGGAGVYLKNRSSVLIKEGYTPTLTGAAGDIAVTNPAVADATWAQVAAGDPVEIMPDGSVKEVA